MIIAEYLARLKARNIILTSQDERLNVDAPRSALTVDDRDTIRQWKDEILAYLIADHPDPAGVCPPSASPAEPNLAPSPALPSITLTCPRCGQPSRIHCAYQGRPGIWFAWCDNPERQCNGKADIVDAADIRQGEVAS